MKQLLLLIVSASFLFIMSCEKFGKATVSFDMEFEQQIEIPSNSGISLPIDVITPEKETNAESTFAVEDTRKDLVEEILLKQATLTITSPEGQDFAFLNDLYLYLRADGLDEILIASAEDIPESIGNVLELNPEDKDFKEYIKKDEFTLRVKAVTDKITNRDVTINVYTEYLVDARILGQ